MPARTAAWIGAMLAVALGYRVANARRAPSLEGAVQDFNEAFNRLDAEAVAAFWTEDGTLVTPLGARGSDRAGVARAYGEDAATVWQGSTSTFTIRSVRRLAAGLAFVDLEQDVQHFRRPDGTVGPVTLQVVLLATRRRGEWRWLDARAYALPPRPEGATALEAEAGLTRPVAALPAPG